MGNYDLKFSHIDGGFCRVYFYHQRPTAGKAWYCLQYEGENHGGMQLYRRTDCDWLEPSHRIKFKDKLVLIERPRVECDITQKAVDWIEKYEADFKAECSEAVTETDEVNKRGENK